MYPRNSPPHDSIPDPKRGDKMATQDGNELILTNYYFCVLPETMDAVIIGMSSTNLTPSRTWQALMKKHKVQKKDGSYTTAPGFVYPVYSDLGSDRVL